MLECPPPKPVNAFSHRPTIGVLAYGMQHTIGHDVWKGIHAVARTHDVNVLWFVGDQIRCPFGEFREQANIIYEFANPDTVDGLLIWGGALFPHLDAEEIQRFSARYHPLPVVCMSHVLPGTPSVVVGNYQGMYDVLAHLIEVHGYRRIAFMRGPTKEGGEADERYRAYCDVLKEYNLPYDPALVMAGNNEKLPAACAMRVLLKERGIRPPKDFEAVVSSNDTMALAILHIFQESGIRVPQDVALVGFDDLGPARAVTPPLTTVKYSFETLGRQAANALLTRLAGEDVPERIVVPLNVIVRESCGCRDANVTRAAVSFERAIKQPASAGNITSSSRQAEILTAIQRVIEPITDMTDQVLPVAEAFLSAIQEGLTRHGLDVLQEVLRQVVVAEGNVEIWQDFVSVMRNQLEAGISEPAQRMCVESLCHQARVVIAKMARRVQEAKRLHMAEQEQILREIGARLLTTFEVEGLMEVLAEELPGLDIPACYVTLYEDPQPYAYPQAAPEWSRVCLAYRQHDRIGVGDTADNNTTGSTERFPTRQLLPQHVLTDGRRYEFVIMPLYFREHQIGVALFEGTPREGTVYHALRTEISSALQGALLVHQVQQNAIEVIRQKSILDTFMATVPDAIYFKDRYSRITQSNQAHARLLGLIHPADTIGKTDFDFFSDKEAHRKYEQEQQVIRTGQPLLELEEPGAQGHWLLTTKMPLRDGQGNIIGTFGISRDITALKHTEQELRRYQDHLEERVKERTTELTHINSRLNAEIIERRKAEEAWRTSEKQYRMLAEHVKDGILIIQAGKLVFVNTAFAEMIGQSVEYLLQCKPADLFPEHSGALASEDVRRNAATDEDRPWQIELKTSDGHTVWTEIEDSPIIWNTQFAVLLTIRNITQAKLREMRLEEERTRLQQENLTFRSAGAERYRFGALVGKSPAMQRVYELIVSAASSDINVLVVGESGTGKELIARTIHQVSSRKDHPFVPVNCASIPETLFEREFFGHRKGAFTGADRNKPGFFDQAHQGILFLDEVTELSPGMQAKLLRVLQDGEYFPLGSPTSQRTDVVIVAATNKSPKQEIAQGRLRQDFFYRIGVIEIESPPLRERRDDLSLLIEHLLEQYRQKQTQLHGEDLSYLPVDVTMLPGEMVEALYAYDWPGNVRELQNVLQRFLATQNLPQLLEILGQPMRSRRLPNLSGLSQKVSLDEAVSVVEKRLIRDTLAQTNNNKSETARRLHITRRTLRLKIQKYQLDR